MIKLHKCCLSSFVSSLFCFGGGEPGVEGPRSHLADLWPPAPAYHSAVAGDGDHGRDPGHLVLAPQITAFILYKYDLKYLP